MHACSSILIVGTILIISLLVAGPDLFLRRFLNFLQGGTATRFDFLSRIVGWFERALFFLCLLYLPSQFVTFIGIWFALKVVGSFNVLQPSGEVSQQWHEQIHHVRRAKFLIFIIGTAISLLWTIFIFFVLLFFFGQDSELLTRFPAYKALIS